MSKASLDESEAPVDSFHDCPVHGISWDRDRFTFTLHLTYILEWIPPAEATGAYRFRICRANLVFHGVADTKLAMDWSGSAPDAEIAALKVVKTGTTPNGTAQRLFEIELSDPDGALSIWSTRYEVRLLGNPELSDVPWLPAPTD